MQQNSSWPNTCFHSRLAGTLIALEIIGWSHNKPFDRELTDWEMWYDWMVLERYATK